MDNRFPKTKECYTDVCNSFGCLNQAIIKIVLPVGSKTISIVVCEDCRLKFQ